MNKFYICKHCGNIVGFIKNTGAPVICCGEKMSALEPNTVDAAHEKHLPEVKTAGEKVTVTVGSTAHPMTEEHHISFVYLETDKGGQRKKLNPGEEPVLTFALADEKPVAAYAYCNLHGLWKTEIN